MKSLTVRPRVKICGVRRPSDAVCALEGGADFLGLNFVPSSKRYLAPEDAAELVREVDGRVPRDPADSPRWIGVFVDTAPAEVDEIAARVGLDLIQFHGDESPREVAPFAPRAIKAFRVRRSADEIDLEPWLALGLWGYLIDTRMDVPHSSGAVSAGAASYGGTGARWDVATFADSPLARERTFLAGGLRPGDGSVSAACAVEPWGIDLCSGVEPESPESGSPIVKDPSRMNAFFQEIHHGET